MPGTLPLILLQQETALRRMRCVEHVTQHGLHHALYQEPAAVLAAPAEHDMAIARVNGAPGMLAALHVYQSCASATCCCPECPFANQVLALCWPYLVGQVNIREKCIRGYCVII